MASGNKKSRDIEGWKLETPVRRRGKASLSGTGIIPQEKNTSWKGQGRRKMGAGEKEISEVTCT